VRAKDGGEKSFIPIKDAKRTERRKKTFGMILLRTINSFFAVMEKYVAGGRKKRNGNGEGGMRCFA
jgi:hypothetical protein